MNALELTKILIEKPSITPKDGECQAYLGTLLTDMGFACHIMNQHDVQNLWAVYGQEGPLFCFAGHTDVVPPGTLADWLSAPFQASEREGYVYGRGAADMKSGLACMITATQRFLKKHSHPKARIAFLLTSDEEGLAIHGTQYVVQQLKKAGERIDWCVITEPSSLHIFGDTIRIGRRGTLTGTLTLMGKQGHVAYPHLALNPIHAAVPFLQDLLQVAWDAGHPHFPPTGFQIVNIQAGTGANNVIPGTLTLDFNFRYNPHHTKHSLAAQVEALLQAHALTYELSWHWGGKPFLTDPDSLLVHKTQAVLQKITGVSPQLSTGGGTSDARFIADICPQIVEIGVLNESIHQVNERVAISDIVQLENALVNLLESVLC